MTVAKKSLLETIKPAFESGETKDEIILKITLAVAQKTVKNPFVFSVKAVEESYYSIADTLGYIMSKETMSKKVIEAISKVEALPGYYASVLTMAQSIIGQSLNSLEDVIPVMKENWTGNFPKVEILGYRENTMLRQSYDILGQNPAGRQGFIDAMQGLLKWDGDISKPAVKSRIDNNIKVVTDHLYENQLLVEKLGIEDYLKLNK